MYGKVREVPQTELTPFYPRSPYGVSKVFAPLHHRQLPRELRPVCGVGHPVQPRIAAARPRVRDAQGHRRRGADQAGARRLAGARQPRRAARLGIRRRLRPGDVADAAAGRSRTTTSSRPARAIRCASWSRWRSATSASTGRSTCGWIRRFLRPAEVDHLIGDAVESAHGARLDAGGRLQGSGAHDGRRGPRAAVPGRGTPAGVEIR